MYLKNFYPYFKPFSIPEVKKTNRIIKLNFYENEESKFFYDCSLTGSEYWFTNCPEGSE